MMFLVKLSIKVVHMYLETTLKAKILKKYPLGESN